MALQSNAVLRCVIANEANMENIQIRSYRTFAKLCGFAVKSYIYNLLDILLGETALLNGMQLLQASPAWSSTTSAPPTPSGAAIDDGTPWNTKFPAALNTYTDHLASYSAGSAWQTEPHDLKIGSEHSLI